MSHNVKSVDYHALLWQQLNKNFGEGTNNTFVMAIGKFLLYSDYSTKDNSEQVAGNNTFELTDACVACNANYNPTGSKISVLWDQLLNQGRGPEPGPELKAAFEAAKRSLYDDWDAKVPSPFYQSYLDAIDVYKKKADQMREDYKKDYDKHHWEAYFNEDIKATSEYLTQERLSKQVAPMLQAINDWEFGILDGTMAPMKKAFQDNKRSLILPDENEKEYFYVSMKPSNWYQWFDWNQPNDSAWMTITMDENSFNATQDQEYKKLGGDVSAGYSFLSLRFGGSGSQEQRIETGDSQGVKISFKVRSVQIYRPWLDPSALKIEKWVVPELAPGAWSTGVLDSNNKGLFPLLTTQIIVAKDITVTAEKFSQEVTENLTKFNAKADAGVIFGLFSFGAGAQGGYAHESHSFDFHQIRRSITLKGAQVIGYTSTLMSKYAV